MFEIIQIITAFLGALGFGILYNIKGNKLLVVGAGGAFSWIVYLLVLKVSGDIIPALFISTMSVALLSEMLARIIKTPVTILMVPMLIPLVPGSDLYYTTRSLMLNEMELFSYYGNLVVKEAAAIAFGIIISACIVQIIRQLNKMKKWIDN